MDETRNNPCNLDAEQALLTGLIRDPDAYERIADAVTDEDFFCREHRLAFAAMTTAFEAGQRWDIVTLAEDLERRGQLADAGGMTYLGKLAHGSAAAINLRHYASIVREQANLRTLIRLGGEQIDAVYQPEGRDAKSILETSLERLNELAERGHAGNGFVSLKEAAGNAIIRIDQIYQSKDGMVGLPTGWTDLDRMTRGLEAGSLVIVAARPSMGKTALATQLAWQVAQQGRPVAFFSLEMSAGSLATRIISSTGRMDHDLLRSAKLDDEHWPLITMAVNRMTTAPLHIDDQSGLSLVDIVTRARRLHRESGGLALIVVDYLGLVATPSHAERHDLAIGRITAGLKGLAKSLGVPVVLLSQLNRDLEKRPNKRPVMADLRDSGSIEQDADLILFIYRDEVYNENSRDKGVAEIIIAKHRNGPTGEVRMAFHGKYTRFDDLAPDWQADAGPSHSGRGRAYDY
jgi:replicative DNA helicase